MITPGEAKKGYNFIYDAIIDSEDAKIDELDTFLHNFSLKYKESINYDNLSYLTKEIVTFDKNHYSEEVLNSVMKNYIDYSLKESSDKNKYLKSLANILSYISSDSDAINNIISLYKNYDGKLKVLEKNKKENYIVEKLDDLIGLENVKKQIKQLADWAYVTKLRKEKGLKANSITMHMVFTGSPGTGKTTVARIIADIYHNLGILKENKLKEVSREDLVAEYLGQSEIKTKKILEESKGGVLFIDEAYSLTKSNDEYGISVVNTILKFMEDNRDNTVIIIAGYQKEIEQFISSNPGLKSRFNTYLTFDNYNSKELLDILKVMVENNDYKLEDKDSNLILSELEKIDTTDISFSNARYVRNLFENATKNQATRIANEESLDKEKLQTLIYEDFYK